MTQNNKMASDQPDSKNAAKRIIEALLFASSEPVSIKILSDLLPDTQNIEALIDELQNDYKGRGIELSRYKDQNTLFFAFRTAPDLADALNITRNVQKQPSRAAMETLSIIAYHQPITKTEIESIRGVATGKGTFDTLIEAGWIKPGRRRETPGRPLTWITSADFLDHFNLESIKDLPGLKELQSSGLLDPRPSIDIVQQTNDLFDDNEKSDGRENNDKDDVPSNQINTQQKRAAS